MGRAIEKLKFDKKNKASKGFEGILWKPGCQTPDIGNAFWRQIGWTKREDLNYYDFTLNEANITAFNG